MVSHADTLVMAVRHYCGQTTAFSAVHTEVDHDHDLCWLAVVAFPAHGTGQGHLDYFWRVVGGSPVLRLCCVSRRWHKLLGVARCVECGREFPAREAVTGAEIAILTCALCFGCRNCPILPVTFPLSDDSDQGGGEASDDGWIMGMAAQQRSP